MTYLSGVFGVIKHDEHPAARDRRPVQRGPLLVPGRRLVAFNAKIAQEPRQDLTRSGWLRARSEQVYVELTIRETSAYLMSRMYRQGCLAEPGGTAYNGDPHGTRVAYPRTAEQQRR